MEYGDIPSMTLSGKELLSILSASERYSLNILTEEYVTGAVYVSRSRLLENTSPVAFDGYIYAMNTEASGMMTSSRYVPLFLRMIPSALGSPSLRRALWTLITFIHSNIPRAVSISTDKTTIPVVFSIRKIRFFFSDVSFLLPSVLFFMLNMI